MKSLSILILLGLVCGGGGCVGDVRVSHTWVDLKRLEPRDEKIKDAMEVVKSAALQASFRDQPVVERWRKEGWLQIYTLPYRRDSVAGGWSHLAIMSRVAAEQEQFQVHIYESEGKAESDLGRRVRLDLMEKLVERFGKDVVHSTPD